MKHKPAPQEQEPSQKTIDGPGSQLRKARERQGLEQAKVAAQLHLSQYMIQALEWDDYEKLPAAVFVQGYLKNYARLLGVDENVVIGAYQDLQPDADQEPLPRNQPDQVARELHNDNRLIGYVTWAVLLVMGVLIFFWWQGRMDIEEVPVSTDEVIEYIEPTFAPGQPEGIIPPQEESLPPIVAGPGERDQETETATFTPESAALPEQPSPTPEPEESVSVDPISERVDAASVTAPSQEPETQPVEPLIEEATPTAEVVDAPPVPAEVATGLVVFEFSGPCWVEVRDANGRARIIGMMQDGMRRNLAVGLGPFRVLIGDIHVARLTVNGEEYDLQRHTRGKVARFTLDPSRL
jgi:cytoskeleton protein RodZ